MTEEQYWKRTSGEVIAVGDMSEHYAKSVLRKMIKKSRQRGQDVLIVTYKLRLMRNKIGEIGNMLDEIKRDLL
jgi:predicted rRNA methylase YqxC with S4 and FtsJ domains